MRANRKRLRESLSLMKTRKEKKKQKQNPKPKTKPKTRTKVRFNPWLLWISSPSPTLTHANTRTPLQALRQPRSRRLHPLLSMTTRPRTAQRAKKTRSSPMREKTRKRVPLIPLPRVNLLPTLLRARAMLFLRSRIYPRLRRRRKRSDFAIEDLVPSTQEFHVKLKWNSLGVIVLLCCDNPCIQSEVL